MTLKIRTVYILLPVLALSACAVPPVSEPETVAVRASSLNPAYSSVNAQVLSDAAKVDYSFAASLDPNVDTVTRLQSSYTQQVGDENLRVGDAVSSIGMWGTSVRYGGMQFGTRSDTRDDVIDSNKLATSGMAVLPTVADALFASAGEASSLSQQSLSVNRSLPSGGESWNLAVKDALGHSETVGGPMIASTRLVREGCSDFSIGLGKVREDYALTSNGYGPMFANTTVTCGAPLGFTVEGHGEYLAEQVAALGFGVARQIGSFGTASVAFAQSNAVSGESGWMSKVGFEHSNSMFNLALRSRFQSREFRDIGSMALTDPIMQRDLASVGVNVTETIEPVAGLCDANHLGARTNQPDRPETKHGLGPRHRVDERRPFAAGQLRLLAVHLIQAAAGQHSPLARGGRRIRIGLAAGTGSVGDELIWVSARPAPVAAAFRCA